MADLKNKRRGGFYWKGVTPYVSVTNVLKVIDKPALRYWFGREVYRAMVVDPSLAEKEALAAPYRKNTEAKDRGSAVHSIVESWKTTEKVPGLDGPYKGYAQAFEKWLKGKKIEIIDKERTVFSKEYAYAGTLDLYMEVDGVKMILDIKTGKDLYPEVHLQLSAYRQAMAENGWLVEETAALLLNEDGTFKYEIGKDKLRGFLACKTMFEELNEEMLKKYGYKGGEK